MMPQDTMMAEGMQEYIPEGFMPAGQGIDTADPQYDEYSPEMMARIENYEMPVYYDTKH